MSLTFCFSTAIGSTAGSNGTSVAGVVVLTGVDVIKSSAFAVGDFCLAFAP